MVDHLTASKTLITFVRICVQISLSSPLPSIPPDLNGKKIQQKIIYNWKPDACLSCSSFSHIPNSCPLNPAARAPPSLAHARGRGRSRSHAPVRRNIPLPALVLPPSEKSSVILPLLTTLINTPLLNDLNLLLVASPSPLATDIPDTSSSSDSHATTSSPTVSVSGKIIKVVTMSLSHSHDLRSNDPSLKSPPKTHPQPQNPDSPTSLSS